MNKQTENPASNIEPVGIDWLTNISDRAVIADLLRTAIQHITNPNGHDDSTAWRVADAGLMLRELLEDNDTTNLIGLDIPTGLGARLPIKVGASK